ncbi:MULTISPECIES: FecR family protein [Butyricimonas]|uniref:FecR family protein n=1 Tax=Butyricimonas TaxID=574697 RepID=UPI0007FB57BA|nr:MULTISPECIES: FecR family protein [Butyricimonas]
MKDELDYLIQRVCNSKKKKKFDEEAGWKKVQARNFHKKKKRHSVILLWSGCAACALIILGCILFVNNLSEPQFPTPLAHNESQHPTLPAKVELTLANGKSIDLEDINDLLEEELGISITRDSIHNQLTYRNNEEHQDSIEIRYNRLVVPRGADFSFELPDGTFIVLNSESVLRFPVQFAADNRTVYLEGEAYFEVTKNENSPFKVITGERKVTVLGTKFNISSYSDDPNWSTTLVEGKVSVSDNGKLHVLHPSEQYIVDNQTGKAEVQQVDATLHTSWLNGKLYFKDTRLEDITRKLERWYDFTFIYQEEDVKDFKFRGVIDKDRSLKETLSLLEGTKVIRFEIKDHTITILKK